MTIESITEGSLQSNRGEPQDPIPQTAMHRRVSSAQLRLAKFIFEREVADFQDVVRAMETGEYQKVDEWKVQAQRKDPPVLLWSLPKFTLKSVRERQTPNP